MRIILNAGLVSAACVLVQCEPRRFNQSEMKTSKDVESQKPSSCPPNYVWVPGNPTPGLGSIVNKNGVAPFCIAKFEMKHPSDVTGRDRDKRDNNAVPVSQPQNEPWTKIARDEARAACERVKLPGFTFALISNGEWQAVARNIESTDANWSGGKIGEGTIPRGHSEQDPKRNLPVTSEADPYDGTGKSASNGWKHKRTHQLSTGDVVWDLSGNVREWLNENIDDLGVDKSNLEPLEITDLRTLSKRNTDLFGTFGNFSNIQNMGFLSAGRSSALARGGHWLGGGAGLFSSDFGTEPGLASSIDGFRCVARPAL